MSEELNNSEEIEQSEVQEEKDYNDVFYSDDGEIKEEDPANKNELEDEEADPAEGNTPGEDGEDPANEVKPDEETPEDEDQPEDEDKPADEAGAVEKWELKWRGQTIEATKEEVLNMAQRNFDSTHKYQEASKLKKSVEKEMDLIEKIRGGDKEALAQLAKQAGVDPIDLIDVDVEDIEQGKPDQAEPFVSQEVSALMEEVAQDEPLYEELRQIEQILPETVVTAMAKDPETFYAIISEVKSGDANIVMPHVQAKLAQLDNVDRAVVLGSPDAYASFYINVKDSLIREEQQKAQPETKSKPKPNKNYAETAVRKSGNRQKNREADGADSMSSDDAYEAILERISKQ